MLRRPAKLPLESSFASLCAFIGNLRTGLLMLGQCKQDINAAVAFTIPTTGWGTDTTVPQYPYYLDIDVSGLLATDIVDVNVAPANAWTASAAEFTSTQSYAGKFRLRCANIPEAAISAEYHVTNTVEYTAE